VANGPNIFQMLLVFETEIRPITIDLSIGPSPFVRGGEGVVKERSDPPVCVSVCP